MNIPDQIFNTALDRLELGESPKIIAADYKDFQEELESLLLVAQMGMNIQKLTPPTPYKAHKYASALNPKTRFFEYLSFFRVAAIPLSLVVALVGGRAIVSATEGSLPGDKLYSLKRATEEVRLTLTQDQDKVASIHVELMQKRLDEVKQAASDGNDETETLALAELKNQTEKTFAEAGPIATANAISKQDPTLLNNLVAVNKEQKDVLSELSISSDSSSAKTIATFALEDSKKNDQALAKIIATVNDQTLADFPSKVSITGNVSVWGTNKVTVEKNTFTVTDQTTITNSDGTTTDFKSISGRATVIGSKKPDGTLIALQILILASEDGTVKGDVTTPTAKPPVKLPPIEPAEPTEPEVITDPTTAQGTFIIEPSESQYYE